MNTASSAGANIWAMAATLLSLPLLLKGLGAQAFGTWVLLQTFSATNGWFSLADLGVVVATTRAVAGRIALDDHDGARPIMSSSLAVCGAIGVIGGLGLAVIGPIVFPHLFRTPSYLVSDLQKATIIFATQIVSDLVINSVEGSLEGLHRVDLSRMVDVLRRTLVVIATATAALTTKSLVDVALAASIATFVSALVAATVTRAQLPGFLVAPRRDEALALLRYGRSIALLRPLGVLQRTMDRLIVGAILGPAAVSLVEIATQLQAGADAVLGATSYAVVPAASWLEAREQHDTLAELAERGTKYSMLATMPFVLLVAMLSGPLIHVWVGPKYAAAAGLAAVAVVNVALAAPLAVGSQMLLGLGRAPIILRAAAIAIVVNLVGSIVLVHVVGIVGTFEATIIASLVLMPLLGIPFLRQVQLGAGPFLRAAVLPSLWPSLALAAVVGGVLALPLGAWPTLIAGGALGLGAYGLAATTLSTSKAERADLKSLVRRRPAGSAEAEAAG